MLGAIRDRLAAPSQPGDVAVFYFSGHGSQMPDVSDDEPDQWDETLVAYDSPAGSILIVVGVVVSVVAYRAMIALGRLPEERRWLR